MLIFIRLKFGKYYPHILLTFVSKYKPNNNVFLLFLKAYLNNDNKNDIPYHLFLLDLNSYPFYPDKFKIKKINGYFNIPILHWREITVINEINGIFFFENDPFWKNSRLFVNITLKKIFIFENFPFIR